MVKPITRCKQCVYASKKGNEEPCRDCAELIARLRKCENFFKPASEEVK